MNNNCLSAFYTLSITICAVYLSFDFFYKINKVKKKKNKKTNTLLTMNGGEKNETKDLFLI